MNQTSQELVDEFKDQAYHMAVHFTVIANHLNDQEGMKMFSDAALELMEAGYHKNPKKEEEENDKR